MEAIVKQFEQTLELEIVEPPMAVVKPKIQEIPFSEPESVPTTDKTSDSSIDTKVVEVIEYKNGDRVVTDEGLVFIFGSIMAHIGKSVTDMGHD